MGGVRRGGVAGAYVMGCALLQRIGKVRQHVPQRRRHDCFGVQGSGAEVEG